MFNNRYLLSKYQHQTWGGLERSIFYRFKRLVAPYLKNIPSSDIEMFVIGQHYGLPTRLLDWTENPLVALFFALNEDYNTESVVWVIDPCPFYTIHIEDEDFRNTQEIIMFFPQAVDNRIISQRGCFTVHPLPNSNENFKPLEEKVLEKEVGINDLWKIVIPNDSKIKNQLLVDLYQIGIGYNFIFPDLAGLSQQIQWELLNDIYSH